eukprot:CAMPEP_0181130496 /NCGR_PEP_ID=MMETSP1071-20121207/29902_1 /TAXON_ID=35127 /ORGANISM="Thalassiosira sp., Strain NH16" /LENGTH=80 /DNA_ID=CAMNT_0023216585 /DNA_START=167 /DNA_END=409 /DNA_ORIENTATION=-
MLLHELRPILPQRLLRLLQNCRLVGQLVNGDAPLESRLLCLRRAQFPQESSPPTANGVDDAAGDAPLGVATGRDEVFRLA